MNSRYFRETEETEKKSRTIEEINGLISADAQVYGLTASCKLSFYWVNSELIDISYVIEIQYKNQNDQSHSMNLGGFLLPINGDQLSDIPNKIIETINKVWMPFWGVLCGYTKKLWEFDVNITPDWKIDAQRYDYVVMVKATQNYRFLHTKKVVCFGIKSETSIEGIKIFFEEGEGTRQMSIFAVHMPTPPDGLIAHTIKYLNKRRNPFLAQYDAHINHIIRLLDQASK